MGRKVRAKKDKFDSLSDEFKDAIRQSSPEDIRKRVSEIALLDCNMKATLKADGEVLNAREKLKNLMSTYRADFKAFKLQIDFANDVLTGKGKDTTAVDKIIVAGKKDKTATA